MLKPIHLIRDFFNSPFKVSIACLVFLFSVLIADGSLLQLYSLYSSEEKMTIKIAQLEGDILELHKKIEQASQPEFVKKKARDHFDLVENDEIIFLFTDQ